MAKRPDTPAGYRDPYTYTKAGTVEGMALLNLVLHLEGLAHNHRNQDLHQLVWEMTGGKPSDVTARLRAEGKT